MKAVLVENNTQCLFVGDWEDRVIGAEDIWSAPRQRRSIGPIYCKKIGKYPPPPGESTVLGLEMDSHYTGHALYSDLV